MTSLRAFGSHLTNASGEGFDDGGKVGRAVQDYFLECVGVSFENALYAADFRVGGIVGQGEVVGDGLSADRVSTKTVDRVEMVGVVGFQKGDWKEVVSVRVEGVSNTPNGDTNQWIE